MKGIKGFQKGHRINVGKIMSDSTKNKIAIGNTKDNPTKEAIHLWVVKWRGKPMECQVCGTKDKKFYDWANIDHSYKRILEDYIRMCRSCHRYYDMEFNNYKK